jgi:hypothetical protein
MGRSALVLALIVAAAAAFVPDGAVAQGPSQDVLCRYLELGAPGPVDNELRLTTTDYVGALLITRRSDAIEVSDEGGVLVCAGPATPTVTNLDRITVRVSRESLDAVVLDLRQGPLAPGASGESDGGPEIEISLEQAPGTALSVLGTSAADHIQLGSLGGGDYGANLNGRRIDSRRRRHG